MDATSQSLAREIENRGRQCRVWGGLNHFGASALAYGCIASSAAAAYFTATAAADRGWLTFLAAAPALLVFSAGTLRFEEKSAWWFSQRADVEGLLRSLRYEGRPVAEVSREFTKLKREYEAKWPPYGKLPSIATKPKPAE